MRFSQLDEIVSLEPGVRIVACRRLTGQEDYLKDHFPQFPVMPGVLMLEALFQASAWLVYATEDFRKPVVLLKEVRNVKFADFVEPGETLEVTAEVVRWADPTVALRAQATVDGTLAVGGRLVVERFCCQERYPRRLNIDRMMCDEIRQTFSRLAGRCPAAVGKHG